ncbi:MAG: thiolase domain-containing protein [Deltaproteobacteria bacterium]|nr:thiolase domain-containing protein [Deltaproteobacteria bacterium]
MSAPVYILGGCQTDFARNWLKEGKDIVTMLQEAVSGGLTATGIEAHEVEVAHVGNFAAELYCKQGHLGGFLAEIDPAFSGIPTSRHEAACASGSVAMMMAAAEIEAGRYDLALIVGVEQMKTVDPATGGDFLGTAAWYEKEAKGVEFPFPKLFGRLGDEYEKRFGLKEEHLARIAEINFSNARRNPQAQTRGWFTDETQNLSSGKYANPVAGRLRVRDCSQVTDGATSLLLASDTFARQYAARRGLTVEQLPRILGWGHRTAPMKFDTKMAESKNSPYILPHTRQAIVDTFRRAALPDVWSVQGIETHDCFTTSEYMAIDHFGLTKPGESWKVIEEGVIEFGGKLPINASGGLIGCGHPVGATGTRQALDAFKQVTGQAGEYQIEGTKKIATLNIGGSGTTTVAMVIGV